MNSIILRTAAMFLLPLLLLFSIVALLRGHNEPGGGFVGGLIAAAAFALHGMSFGTTKTRNLLYVDLRVLIGIGLVIAVASGLPALLSGAEYFKGLWTEVDVPGIGPVKIGTPLAFDIGVYLTVIGTALLMVFELQED